MAEHSRKVARDKQQWSRRPRRRCWQQASGAGKDQGAPVAQHAAPPSRWSAWTARWRLHREYDRVAAAGRDRRARGRFCGAQARLKDARRRQGAATQRMTTSRRVRGRHRSRPVLQVASPENRYKAADDASVRCRLSAARADRGWWLNRKSWELPGRFGGRTTRVTALLSAAGRGCRPARPGPQQLP